MDSVIFQYGTSNWATLELYEIKPSNKQILRLEVESPFI